jgi:hypothetical protein
LQTQQKECKPLILLVLQVCGLNFLAPKKLLALAQIPYYEQN